MLRRAQMAKEDADRAKKQGDSPLTAGNLQIDLLRHEVKLDNHEISLKPKEFELLLFLMRNQGQVFSRDQLLEQVWGWEFLGGSRTVDVHVRWLRSKIEKEPEQPTRIITVRSVGYRFEG